MQIVYVPLSVVLYVSLTWITFVNTNESLIF